MFKRLVRFKSNLLMMWYACRHPRTPLYIKLLMGAIALYVISPVDIIPDVLPIVGWLDDALLVPLGVSFLLKRLPEEVRRDAATGLARPGSKNKKRGFTTSLLVMLAVWLLLLGYTFFHWLS